MKLSSSAAALLLAPLAVTATPASFFGSGQDVIAQDFPVDGDNPLEFCTEPSSNLLDIKSVDLAPNPPKPLVA